MTKEPVSDVPGPTSSQYYGSRIQEGRRNALSEHEQRILAELEESLSKQDPRFAKNVRETNVYSHGGRRVRWGIAGFIAARDSDSLFFHFGALGLVGVA